MACVNSLNTILNICLNSLSTPSAYRIKCPYISILLYKKHFFNEPQSGSAIQCWSYKMKHVIVSNLLCQFSWGHLMSSTDGPNVTQVQFPAIFPTDDARQKLVLNMAITWRQDAAIAINVCHFTQIMITWLRGCCSCWKFEDQS